jgi:hypothetical protein
MLSKLDGTHERRIVPVQPRYDDTMLLPLRPVAGHNLVHSIMTLGEY